MTIEELKEKVKVSRDRLELLKDVNQFNNMNITVTRLMEIYNEVLNDNDKVRFLNFDYVRNFSAITIANMITNINNSELKLATLLNPKITKNIPSYSLARIISTLEDPELIFIIRDENYLRTNKLLGTVHKQIMYEGLSDLGKQSVLRDKKLVEKDLGLTRKDMPDFVASLETEVAKDTFIEMYKIEKRHIPKIIDNLSDKRKKEIIEENKYNLSKEDLVQIVSTMTADAIIDILKNNREMVESEYAPFYVFESKLSQDKKDRIYNEIDKLGFSEKDRRISEVFLGKDKDLQVEYGKILFNPEAKDFSIYQNLDEFIYVNPMQLTKEQREEVYGLKMYCPNVKIRNDTAIGESTIDEFIEGEEWIDEVISSIDPNWNELQKIAYINHAIGKKISYSRDVGTEVYNEGDSRAVWKAIVNGQAVCNGITQISKYMLDQVGVESKIIGGDGDGKSGHSFLKILDIEIPTENGLQTGNTILDPTWCLSEERYGAYPPEFCRCYQSIRKEDRVSGKDTGYHKSDDAKDCLLEITDIGLREVYRSLGLTDAEGYFPIKALVDILNTCPTEGPERISSRLKALSEYLPEFAECNNSTANIIRTLILNPSKVDYENCIAKRVYNREDETKRPVLYVYADLGEDGKQFFVAEKDAIEFTQMSKEDFEKQYSCFEKDLQETKGVNPWNIGQTIEFDRESSNRQAASEGKEGGENR